MTTLETVEIPEGHKLVFKFVKLPEKETRGRKQYLKDIPEDQLTQRQKYRIKANDKIREYNKKYYERKKQEKMTKAEKIDENEKNRN